MAESKWFRQDTAELKSEWLFFLSPEERLAWIYIKAYIKDYTISQKRPGVALAKPVRVAAHEWNIPAEAVESILGKAADEGEIILGDGTWEIADKAGFVTERTAKKTGEDFSEKPEPVTPENTFFRKTGKNGAPKTDFSEKRGNACHVTVTETVTETDNTTTQQPARGNDPPDGLADRIREILFEVPALRRVDACKTSHIRDVIDRWPQFDEPGWIGLAQDCRDSLIAKKAFGENSSFEMSAALKLSEFVDQRVRDEAAFGPSRRPGGKPPDRPSGRYAGSPDSLPPDELPVFDPAGYQAV